MDSEGARADGGLSPASLGMDRAAIRYHHTEAGLANPFLPRPASVVSVIYPY